MSRPGGICTTDGGLNLIYIKIISHFINIGGPLFTSAGLIGIASWNGLPCGNQPVRKFFIQLISFLYPKFSGCLHENFMLQKLDKRHYRSLIIKKNLKFNKMSLSNKKNYWCLFYKWLFQESVKLD